MPSMTPLLTIQHKAARRLLKAAPQGCLRVSFSDPKG